MKKEAYDIFLNGEFYKSYTSLRGVQIAYGRLDNKIMKGEISVTVPKGSTFLAWKLRDVERIPYPASTYDKSFNY